MVFEIACGPGLLKFFKAEDFVALAAVLASAINLAILEIHR